MRFTTKLTAVIAGGLISATTLAGELPKQFTLGRFVPDNAWLFINTVQNPEREWVDAQTADVFDALKASGIDRDMISLVLSMIQDDEQRTEVEASLDKLSSLVNGVDWQDLFSREYVFAERIGNGLPGYEYIFLARGADGSAESNMRHLVEILQGLGELGDEIEVASRTVHGVKVWSASADAESDEDSKYPISVSVFRKNDIIGVLMGTHGTAKDVLGLMSGRGTAKSIVSSARFQAALAEINAPETSLMFFDVKHLLKDVSVLMNKVIEVKGGDPEDEAKIRRLLNAVVGLTDFLDYTIVSTEMDGRRELIHTVARIQEPKLESPIVQSFVSRRPFDRFDRYIPADATDFSVSTFVDLEKLYDTVLDLVRDHVPSGPELTDKWKAWLASVGFDPQRDLFAWWSGEIIKVTLPAEMVSPMNAGGTGVIMIRVKDSALAASKVNAALDFVSLLMQAKGQMLVLTPAKVDAEGFREITHPMLAMASRPVIGVKDEWLIVGATGGAINKCLAVAAGKAPSIMENPQFRNEGIIPAGPVYALSFADTSDFGQELAKGLGMAGMIAQMFTAGLPDDKPEAAKIKPVVQRLVASMMKLGPVLRKLDFYSSESTATTIKGSVVRTERVVTFKGPPTDEALPATATADGTK